MESLKHLKEGKPIHQEKYEFQLLCIQQRKKNNKQNMVYNEQFWYETKGYYQKANSERIAKAPTLFD